MRIRLEKINHIKRQRRFYELDVQKTLFGNWCLNRSWGRIGNQGGRSIEDVFGSESEANQALEALKSQKLRRGYASIPVQLKLF
ncbi:WGR domain-containing protein [Shimia biformata]|uniref:WGR domain-containing protein n=1 Tax=Shimia biformata TaxID=1294299 RepID=UPI0019525E2D